MIRDIELFYMAIEINGWNILTKWEKSFIEVLRIFQYNNFKKGYLN